MVGINAAVVNLSPLRISPGSVRPLIRISKLDQSLLLLKQEHQPCPDQQRRVQTSKNGGREGGRKELCIRQEYEGLHNQGTSFTVMHTGISDPPIEFIVYSTSSL